MCGSSTQHNSAVLVWYAPEVPVHQGTIRRQAALVYLDKKNLVPADNFI
jgi:hypothetical protein